jgi:hypothetical protein
MAPLLSRNEMIRALVVAVQKVHPDKRISVNEDKLLGSNKWSVTVDGLGHFDGDYACDVLKDVRAAKGLDEVDAKALVDELMTCAEQSKTAPQLGPAAIALAPGDAPAAPAAPVIDYDKLAAAMAAQAKK